MNVIKLYSASDTAGPQATHSPTQGAGYRIQRLIPDTVLPPGSISNERKAVLRQRLESGFYFQPENLRVISRCLARDIMGMDE